MRSCCRSISASPTSTSAWAPRSAKRRTWSAKICSRPTASSPAPSMPTHSPIWISGRARTYGKVGGFAHLETLVDKVRASPARFPAAGRRRHLAGFRHRPVDQCPGHGGCLYRAGRGRHDAALGNDLRRRSGQGNRRQRFQGPASISSPRTSSPTNSATRCSSPTS